MAKIWDKTDVDLKRLQIKTQKIPKGPDILKGCHNKQLKEIHQIHPQRRQRISFRNREELTEQQSDVQLQQLARLLCQ